MINKLSRSFLNNHLLLRVKKLFNNDPNLIKEHGDKSGGKFMRRQLFNMSLDGSPKFLVDCDEKSQ